VVVGFVVGVVVGGGRVVVPGFDVGATDDTDPGKHWE
jgi:hypothetical protein